MCPQKCGHCPTPHGSPSLQEKLSYKRKKKKKKKNPNSKNASSEGSVSPQAHAVIIQHVQSPHKTSSLASSPASYLYLTSQQGAREASEGTTRVCKATVYKMVQNIFSTTRSQRRAGYLLLLQLPCLLGRVRTWVWTAYGFFVGCHKVVLLVTR